MAWCGGVILCGVEWCDGVMCVAAVRCGVCVVVVWCGGVVCGGVRCVSWWCGVVVCGGVRCVVVKEDDSLSPSHSLG